MNPDGTELADLLMPASMSGGVPNVHTGHKVEVDEAGVEEVEDKAEVGEVEEDNRDKEEQSSRSSSLIVRAGAESTSNQH